MLLTDKLLQNIISSFIKRLPGIESIFCFSCPELFLPVNRIIIGRNNSFGSDQFLHQINQRLAGFILVQLGKTGGANSREDAYRLAGTNLAPGKL